MNPLRRLWLALLGKCTCDHCLGVAYWINRRCEEYPRISWASQTMRLSEAVMKRGYPT